MQSENRKKKGVKKNEQSLRSVRVAEREKKREKDKIIIENDENFPNLIFFFKKKGFLVL